jgi:hypothetical protein
MWTDLLKYESLKLESHQKKVLLIAKYFKSQQAALYFDREGHKDKLEECK